MWVFDKQDQQDQQDQIAPKYLISLRNLVVMFLNFRGHVLGNMTIFESLAVEDEMSKKEIAWERSKAQFEGMRREMRE